MKKIKTLIAHARDLKSDQIQVILKDTIPSYKPRIVPPIDQKAVDYLIKAEA